MNLTTIQDRLNDTFRGGERIIFWFDPNGDYSEDIAGLTVSAKLLVLTGSNALYAKALLESDDPTGCYLVYAPFARPADADFHLADTVYYSRVFSTDKITQLMQELRIPEGMKATLAKYPLFWKSNARIEKFAALELDAYTSTTIDIAVLCVQCGARVVSFDEVLKKVLGAGLEKGDAMLKTFDSVGALSSFWQLCARYYGYEEPAPQLARLVATLLCTYTVAAHVALPDRYRQYVTTRKNNVCVFLSNFMSGAQTRPAFDELSAAFAQRLQIREAFEKLDAAQLLEVDAFAVADELLLARATALLLSEDIAADVGGLSLPQLVQQRAQSGLHFTQQFQAQYALLLHARTLIAAAGQKPQYKTARAMAEGYRTVLCEADTAYRQFCTLYDRLPDQAPYEKLARLMERIYCNDLLDACTRQFSDLLADTEPAALGLPMQEHFAETYIRPRVGRERTFVIISDALRYECARDLLKRLTDDEKCDATLDAALATLPSITRLGMAALLPHRQIRVSPDFTVTLDGLPCGDLASREKVLTAAYPDGLCLKLDSLLAMPKKDLRERCNGKDVVYIYHDQIDARGDDPTTENEVFFACEEAIAEIQRCIHKLTDDLSATYFIVTADHGFQYRRSPIAEYEKIDVGMGKTIAAAKRYRVTRASEGHAGTLSFLFPYTAEPSVVTVPMGASIFKAQGGSGNYVHGGSSLAEILIPILTVKTRRGRQEVQSAPLTLVSGQRKINNLITYLEFMQSLPISDVVKPTQYKAYFVDEADRVVSSEEVLPAISASPLPEQRLLKQRFTLRNRKYSAKDRYYLVLQDTRDALAQPQRIEYTIDIAFADDFGFRL